MKKSNSELILNSRITLKLNDCTFIKEMEEKINDVVN
jgi:hypothetical protein